MFLSTFLSFVLAKKFRGRIYVLLAITVTVPVSFFSAFGWITGHERMDFRFDTVQYWTFHPVPLSFPFYASVSYDFTVIPLPIDGSRFTYKISFVVFEITRATTYYPSPFTLWNASMYYLLFLLINVAGTIGGYCIGRRY